MSNPSEKHMNIVMERIGTKSVYQLPGVDLVVGGRLENIGFTTAQHVIGQFLAQKKDKKVFQDWFQDTCKADSKQAELCYNCIKEYCATYL